MDLRVYLVRLGFVVLSHESQQAEPDTLATVFRTNTDVLNPYEPSDPMHPFDRMGEYVGKDLTIGFSDQDAFGLHEVVQYAPPAQNVELLAPDCVSLGRCVVQRPQLWNVFSRGDSKSHFIVLGIMCALALWRGYAVIAP